LENSGLRETEDDSVSGESMIAVGDSVNLLFDDFFIKGIETNFLDLSAVNCNSD
jgi:hypothetical protein